ASGAKYVSAGTTFWSRGELATLETPDGSRPDCRGRPAATPWEEAALLGVEFRAVGQEPGWLLDIDEGRWLRYVGDYGSTRAFAPAPRRDSAGGTVTYRARSEGRELTVEIREAPCRDVMSGEAYSHTVTVRLDTSEVHGCGRQPELGATTDRYWTLTELEGRPAIAGEPGREAHLRLSEHGQRMAGSTGCNSLSGQYRQDGDRLRFGPIVTTLMACADTALAAQEREFLGMLELVDRSVVAGDEVTLYDGDRVVARFTAGRRE
ncbi:MAG TPA: META domain-containing protein, partial [Gemmatimonadales bacterium]